MQTQTIELTDAQAHFKELIDRVNSGVHIILSDNEKPVAQLLPVSGRVAGLHAGRIQTSDDFDAPLSDALWSEGK